MPAALPSTTTGPRRRARSGKPTAGGVRQVAQETLGLETLWPGQEEALLAVLGGNDTLVLLPTGAGKSASSSWTQKPFARFKPSLKRTGL